MHDSVPAVQGTDEEKQAAELALVAVLEAVRVVAVLLAPVTPQLSGKIYGALGYGPEVYKSLSWGDASWGILPQGQSTPPAVPVFARLEGDNVTEVASGKSTAVAA